MLVTRYKFQRKLVEKRRHGTDPKDCLLFDGAGKKPHFLNLICRKFPT